MASQTLRTRDATTNLTVCDTQTSGTLNLGASASRTGDIVIGHASQTATALAVDTGSASIHATTGNCEVRASTGTVYLGGQSDNVPTRLGNGVTTDNIIIGTSQSTGQTFIGANAGRSGPITLGSSTGTHETRIRGADLIVTQSGNATFDVGGTIDMNIATLDIDTTADATITAATTMDIQSGTTTTITSVGAMVLDSTSTNELNASTTTLVKGGTGLTLTATTGTLDMNADGGAATLDSSTSTTITAGTTVDITAVGELDINTTGANNSLFVEAKGSGATTFLGGVTANTTTRLHNAATTAGLVIGSNQTSGTITIGAGGTRTGQIQIGGPTADFSLNARSGTMNLETKDAAGAFTIVSADTLDIDAVDDVTIDSSGGTVLVEGVDMVLTSKTSWTPTIGSIATDFTMSTQIGQYTRWGNMVTYTFTLAWTDLNSATGDIKIKGLPFTGAMTNALGVFTDKTWLSGSVAGMEVHPLSQDGQTYLDIRYDSILVDEGDVDASGAFSGSITVPIA